MLLIYLVLTTVAGYRYFPDEKTYIHYHDQISNDHVNPTTNIAREQAAYHAIIVYNNLYCSGSIISSSTILTSASCFRRPNIPKVMVKVGSTTITGYGQVIPVLEYKIHEYFRHTSPVDNDIALLYLKSNIVFSNSVKKVVLLESDMALRSGSSLSVTGWGSGNLDPKLMNLIVKTVMTTMTEAECKETYGPLATRSNFCARYDKERHLSDNGGGAVFFDLLIGVLSFGGTNIDKPHVAVFTNVSFFHRWIQINSLKFIKKYCKKSIATLKQIEELDSQHSKSSET